MVFLSQALISFLSLSWQVKADVSHGQAEAVFFVG